MARVNIGPPVPVRLLPLGFPLSFPRHPPWHLPRLLIHTAYRFLLLTLLPGIILILAVIALPVSNAPDRMLPGGSADHGPEGEATSRGTGEQVPVTFTRTAISTTSGTEETTFVFTATIVSEREPADPVEVVIEGRPFAMREVDPADVTHSDGKEYQYIGSLDPGPKFYFFRCGNESTGIATFNVRESHLFEQYHPDLLLAMGVFIPPMVYSLVLLHRMKGYAIAISGTLHHRAAHSRYNAPRCPAGTGAGSPKISEGHAVWGPRDGPDTMEGVGSREPGGYAHTTDTGSGESPREPGGYAHTTDTGSGESPREPGGYAHTTDTGSGESPREPGGYAHTTDTGSGESPREPGGYAHTTDTGSGESPREPGGNAHTTDTGAGESPREPVPGGQTP